MLGARSAPCPAARIPDARHRPGIGFLKPNIPTIVGKLDPANDPRRDSGSHDQVAFDRYDE